MNRPKGLRLRLLMTLAAVAAIAAISPSIASADITTVATGIWGPDVNNPITPTPGAHEDYTIRQDFTYDALTEDMKKWIADSPAGLIGDPNQIPWSDRCTIAQFNPATQDENLTNPAVQTQDSACPATSQVGSATVTLAFDAPFGPYAAGDVAGQMTGKIYLLQTSPEIPVKLATNLTPSPIASAAVCASLGMTAPCQVHPKTMSVLAPVTNLSTANNGDTDFRIRTVPMHYSSRPVTYPVADAPGPTPIAVPLHIIRIDQHLFGTVNGKPFLTNPSRLDGWDSISYARAHDSNSTATLPMDPNNPADLFVKSAAHSQTPAQVAPPLKAAVSAALSGSTRGGNPALSVTVADPTASDDQQPKKLVTTLPASVSIDVKALNNVCTWDQRDADACPAASQVGTATVSTPLIQAGLTGRVYMTSGQTPGLPFLSIFVDGAVKFRLDATTRFVGPKFNEIETTFDNLPQSPFTNFTVNINGGAPGSLLYNRECPTNGDAPADGPVNFTINGYGGSASASSSPTALDPCYGANNPKKVSKCQRVSKKFKVKPKGLIATSTIKNVQLLTGSKTKSKKSKKSKLRMHRRATDSKAPFSFKLTLKKSKFKTNRTYYYGYKVTYKDGHVIKTKSAKFKTCKARRR